MHLYLLHCILHHYYKSFQLRKDHDKPLLFVFCTFLYATYPGRCWILFLSKFHHVNQCLRDSVLVTATINYHIAYLSLMVSCILKKIITLVIFLNFGTNKIFSRILFSISPSSASYFNPSLSSLCKHMKIIKNQNLLRHFV